MGQKILKNNFFILFTLFLIGFIVHFKSFQMVPYGDDWKFIYNYYNHEEKSLNFSNFPGIFAYLSPYGPSILIIGLTYQIFEKAYFVYYLIPLTFKTLAAFFLFKTLKNISHNLKKDNNLIIFLAAVLFMVSMTGIQAIDWAMNTNVYIALSIFSLSLFFQSKYYISLGKLNLILGFLLAVFSIIFAPTRFTPFVLIFPLLDLVLVLKGRNKIFLFSLILKNIIFVILTYIFLQIGIFGNPGQLNNTSRLHEFIAGSTADLHLSFVMFMHWIGITILPTYPPLDIYKTSIGGALFTGLLIWTFFKSRNEWIIIGSLIFFTTLGIMWIISPLLVVDSALRYLAVPFFGLCFLIGLILIFSYKLKKFLILLLLILFIVQVYSVNNIYSYFISIGRGKDFIIPIQNTIMNHFLSPINSPRIVYLDFDNGAVQQSVVFGLGYRIAVFSGTKKISLFPKLIVDKSSLTKTVNDEILSGMTKDQVINSISAFQYKNEEFSDITSIIQQQLRN